MSAPPKKLERILNHGTKKPLSHSQRLSNQHNIEHHKTLKIISTITLKWTHHVKKGRRKNYLLLKETNKQQNKIKINK